MKRDEITSKMSGKLNRSEGVASGLAAGILGKKTEAGVRVNSPEVRSFAELHELHEKDPGFLESLFYLAISPVVLPLVAGHWIYENLVRTKIRNPAFAELGGAKLEDVLYSADGNTPIPVGNNEWLLPSNYSYFGRESEVCDKETYPKRSTDESSADEETTAKANALVDRATKSLGSGSDWNCLSDNG